MNAEIFYQQLCIAESALEKGHVSAVNTDHPVREALPSAFIKVFALDKVLMSALNGKSFLCTAHLNSHQVVHT